VRQCDWCGLITDDDKICSWCKHTNEGIAAAPAPVVAEPRSVWKPKVGWVAAALAAVIGAVLLFPKAAPAAEGEDVGLAQTQDFVSVSTGPTAMGSSADDFPQPKRQYGSRAVSAYSPANEGSVEEDAGDDADLEDWMDGEPVARVALASAQLASEIDEDGNEVVGGMVTIVNDGDYPVTSLRLTVDIDGTSYPLTYSGFSGRVEPGEEVSLPVMMSGSRMASGGFQVRTVSMQATTDGGDICTDSAFALPL
jgi:hypothetical protein